MNDKGVRIYDLARRLAVPSRELLNFLKTKGIEVKSAIDVAHALEPIIRLTISRVVFSIGILSMCLTTMVLEMVICGFVLSEMFKFELHGRSYKLATLVANISVLGAFYAMPFWLPIITSSFNLIIIDGQVAVMSAVRLIGRGFSLLVVNYHDIPIDKYYNTLLT